MMQIRCLSLLVVCGGLCLLTLSGCANPNSMITVSGTLVLPPNIKLEETDSVQITFVPKEAGKPGASADFSVSDKSFVVKDVSPGSYKITVHLRAYAGMKDSPARDKTFKKLNETFDLDETNLTYNVADEPQQSIVIDLVQETIKKK